MGKAAGNSALAEDGLILTLFTSLPAHPPHASKFSNLMGRSQANRKRSCLFAINTTKSHFVNRYSPCLLMRWPPAAAASPRAGEEAERESRNSAVPVDAGRLPSLLSIRNRQGPPNASGALSKLFNGSMPQLLVCKMEVILVSHQVRWL